ncbi:hypothetical protein, partial [Ventosimonas gracilis]|uniref:hypothetical protein n=1 Tax=Ventosimonas gracilis TaxID=1680762 RepID=UPI00195E5274
FGGGQIQRKVANNLTKSRFADFRTFEVPILPVISGSYHAIKTCLLPKTQKKINRHLLSALPASHAS